MRNVIVLVVSDIQISMLNEACVVQSTSVVPMSIRIEQLTSPTGDDFTGRGHPFSFGNPGHILLPAWSARVQVIT